MIAIVIALTNLCFVFFILPESLPPSRRLSRVPSSVDHDSQQQNRGALHRIIKTMRDVALQFLRPATLFIPMKLEGRRGHDWNLTLTGAALFIYVLGDVSLIRVQYAGANPQSVASIQYQIPLRQTRIRLEYRAGSSFTFCCNIY